MATKSKLEEYKLEIYDLIKKGASIRSSWILINYTLPVESKISYNAFYHFVKKHILNEQAKK